MVYRAMDRPQLDDFNSAVGDDIRLSATMYTGIGSGVTVGIGVLALLIPTIALNVPLLLICIVARRRLGPWRAAWVVTSGFVSAGGFLLTWESWRYGVPLPRMTYLLSAYVPSVLAVGCIGWWLGRWIGRDFELSVPQAPEDFTKLTR
jgi:hypothetical protein